MFFIRWVLFLTILTSCRPARFSTVKVATSFEADSSLFSELKDPTISYYDLNSIVLLYNSLASQKKTWILINKPTLVRCFSAYAIVYPGENIRISIDKNADIVFHTNNEQRNRELAFQNIFQSFDQKLWPQFPGRSGDFPIDTILLFEQKMKSEIPFYFKKSIALLDSLAIAYNISDNLKRLSHLSLKNKQYNMLFYFYHVYKKELNRNSLYQQKLKDILPIYSGMTEQDEVDFEGADFVTSLADDLMKIKILNIRDNDEITKAIHFINEYFTHLSRDFLLSKLIYYAVYNGILISNDNMGYYRRSCKDADYKKIISREYSDRKRYAEKSKRKKDNRLIALYDLRIHTLNEVIAQHKGKLILIDIWASWCAPCLEQIPYAEKLSQQFSHDKIVFLYLSTDRQLINWQHKNSDIGIDSNYSYIFENFTKQSFLKNNSVSTIPRYILIDQNGEIINADTPPPSDPKLKEMIDKYLK